MFGFSAFSQGITPYEIEAAPAKWYVMISQLPNGDYEHTLLSSFLADSLGVGTDTNLANTSLTWTADRSHDLDGYDLTFDTGNLYLGSGTTGEAVDLNMIGSNGTADINFYKALSKDWALTYSTSDESLGFVSYEPDADFYIDIMDFTTPKEAFYIDASVPSIRFHDAYTFPNTDGSNGQYLQTDGAGNVSWASGSSYTGWTIDGDAGDTEAITTQTVLFAGSGIASTSYSSGANTLTITATEVDGSITNEIQTISGGQGITAAPSGNNYTISITDNTIDEPMLKASNLPTDNYLLSYDLATDGFTWVTDSGTSYWTRNATYTTVYPTTATDYVLIGSSDAAAYGNHELNVIGNFFLTGESIYKVGSSTWGFPDAYDLHSSDGTNDWWYDPDLQLGTGNVIEFTLNGNVAGSVDITSILGASQSLDDVTTVGNITTNSIEIGDLTIDDASPYIYLDVDNTYDWDIKADGTNGTLDIEPTNNVTFMTIDFNANTGYTGVRIQPDTEALMIMDGASATPDTSLIFSSASGSYGEIGVDSVGTIDFGVAGEVLRKDENNNLSFGRPIVSLGSAYGASQSITATESNLDISTLKFEYGGVDMDLVNNQIDITGYTGILEVSYCFNITSAAGAELTVSHKISGTLYNIPATTETISSDDHWISRTVYLPVDSGDYVEIKIKVGSGETATATQQTINAKKL